ncbi:hypothetical protein RQP46_001946 [Phenoliferia psychrophenolica]
MSVDKRRQTMYSKASTSSVTTESEIDPSSQMFTIGKIDAGIAVLISDSVHLIEFPSLLLPAGVGPGSIVNISCSRNVVAEKATSTAFWDLQETIFEAYGAKEPSAPKLRVRNVTQTSVTLEWDKLDLAEAKLLGLSIWRNGQRLTTIPNPGTNTSTKLSGLALDTDYSFHLMLKTSAGTYTSPTVKVHTHTIADTSGVSVCFGLCEPSSLLEEARAALVVMKGRAADKIQIDTTHFVATSPAAVGNPNGGPGVEYQKALQLSIPVVSPEWVIACAREHKMVPIANYYSVGTTNHAASLSSANLVLANGTLPASKQSLPRRATVVAIEEEPVVPAPVPVVPETIPQSKELAEEEPDAPPEDQRVEPPVPVVVEEETPAPVAAVPEIVVDEPKRVEEEGVAVEEPEKEVEEEGVAVEEKKKPKEDDGEGLDDLVGGSGGPAITVTSESMEDVGL